LRRPYTWYILNTQEDRKRTHNIAACLTNRSEEVVVSLLPGGSGPLVLLMSPDLLFRLEFSQLSTLNSLLSRIEGLALFGGGALTYPRVLLQRLWREGPRAKRARKQDRRICVHLHGPTISRLSQFKFHVIIVDVLYTYRCFLFLSLIMSKTTNSDPDRRVGCVYSSSND